MFVIWCPPDEEKKNRLTKNPVLQFVSNYWTGKKEYWTVGSGLAEAVWRNTLPGELESQVIM